MQPDLPNATTTQINYQPNAHAHAIEMIRLVGVWCIVIGALAVGGFALTVLGVYQVNANQLTGILNLFRGQEAVMLAEISRIIVSGVVMIAGIRLLRGEYRGARYLWIVLMILVITQLVLCVATIIVSLPYYTQANRLVALISLGIQYLGLCTPTVILMSILRRSTLRAAIEAR